MARMFKHKSERRWPSARRLAALACVVIACCVSLFACAGKTAVEMTVQPPADRQNSIKETTVNMPHIEEILALNGEPDPGDETPPPIMSHGEDYHKYREKNSDVVAWISVPNTRIEYPVARAEDNEYYLTHNIEKEKSKSGAVFMDFRNTDPKNARHILLYGHNMRNGSMFHDLNSFKEKSVFDNNRDITLYIGDEVVKYEIYAAFIISADLNFMETKFADDEAFTRYMEALQDMSKFTAKPRVKITPEDHILTLVTCTYEYDDSRFAIQARRVS